VCVTDNSAKSGGAVLLIIANENIEFQDCIFQNNSALLVGGAVMVSYDNERIRFYGA
jgi:hypothetical protein